MLLFLYILLLSKQIYVRSYNTIMTAIHKYLICVLLMEIYKLYLHILIKLTKQIKRVKVCNTKLKLHNVTYAFQMQHQYKKRN